MIQPVKINSHILIGLAMMLIAGEIRAQENLSSELKVKDIVITGNEITKEDIILREMRLKKGSRFTEKKYKEDILNIYNLGLFTKVDIVPIPQSQESLMLDVQVQERWYILPMPQAGIEDGEWDKKWLGLNIIWENFRGRNETVSLNFRILYNPFIKGSYSVPWIGDKLHLYASIGASYSKTRNKSLAAVGKTSGGEIITGDEYNYDNTEYSGDLTVGKYLTRRFSVFTKFGYDYLRVSEFAPGRTVSPSGKDKYLTFGAGIKFDSRNILEYATKGYYLITDYSRYGHLDDVINFGRFSLEGQSFVPIHFSRNYFVTAASRLFYSLAVGAVIPVYHRQYLGYSEDYVRGWKGAAFEGENKLTVYNELRIPLIEPRYMEAKNIPVVKDVPIVGKMHLKYGLFLTFLYDVGGVWSKSGSIFDARFMSGTGIGLNAILPFGYIVRTEWAFRLGKPTVGHVGLSLSAKF